MKTLFRLFLCSMIMFASVSNADANTTQTTSQVTESVTVSNDVDYVITNATPFTTAGSVDITNTEHAVVIIKRVKPSVVISTWLKNHVFINGQQAVNGTNCQVKMYAEGAIIMPYAKDIKPLTVYSEQNFGGTSVNSFGLENTGGYMNTLTEAKLNNKIRSFKLKRGYMVTFSTLPSGYGYSRCFIADTEDLEFATLPAVLDNTISSYRVFQWYDAPKKGVGSDTRGDYVSLVGGGWCYDWALGSNLLPDIECVPNHIYEDWPSSSACGGVTYSCHLKTNNEPGNSADDHPQSVEQVLANWQNLMRTGLRLCSESSHDGSMGHLKAFMDSIDARGWRCDILDLHCYWAQGTFNNINWYISEYGKNRPVWISEWVWGASWNNNGAFAVSNRGDFYGNQENTYNGTKPILEQLNANDRVERYAYWNSEADCSKIYRGTELSKLGEYYRDMETGVGYKKKYDYIPKNPRQYDPSNFKAEYDKDNGKVLLTWHDGNGEYNRSMAVELQKPGSSTWTVIYTPEQKEEAADYKVEVEGRDGYKYRVVVEDLLNKKRYSNVASAVNDNLTIGDEVSVGEETWYLGGNMLLNGDFSLGLLDWTNGKGEPLSQPYFEAVPKGGVNNGPYLQAYGDSSDKLSEQSVRRTFNLEENGHYYVQAAGCNGPGSNQKISTTSNELIELYSKVALPAVTQWTKQGIGFATTTDQLLMIQFRSCGGKSQFDEVIVAKLFPTREEALADALVWAKKRAELFKTYNTQYPTLNAEIDEIIASCTSAKEVLEAVENAVAAVNQLNELKGNCNEAQILCEMKAEGYDVYAKALADLEAAVTAKSVSEAYAVLKGATYPYVINNESIVSGNFSSTTGWSVKQGTYKDGDQRTATQAGKTCWNAWWSGISASQGKSKTMAIKQSVEKLPHGFYALEAKAATQHYCVTDQHAFLEFDGKTYSSVPMRYGVLDLPTIADKEKWETLVTPYVFLTENDAITIGFEGSKEGAIDNAWHAYASPSNTGDRREGWWNATDFQLRHIPAYQRKMGETPWHTICLPYQISVPEGVTLYQLAGITADSTRICLEPAQTFVPGTPYVFKCEEPVAIFFETGKKVTSAQTNVNGLRGNLVPSAKFPLKALVLEGDEWTYVTERYPMREYEGYIYKVEQLKVLDGWNGEFLWTKGLVSDKRIEDAKTGVEHIVVSGNAPSPLYNIAGQRITEAKQAKGIVITKNKKTLIK